jgi:subtilase family serine protease
MHRKSRALLVLAVAALLALLIAGSSAATPSQRATLAGSVPAWATSANFKVAASATDPVNFRVYLGWRNAAAAEALARAVSDPASLSYGKYLTPAQFRKQFAPSQSQVGAVQAWLRAQGFTVDYTPTNNHYVAAEGTVAQAAAAFGTTFGMYSVQGKIVRSPATDVLIPTSLASIVTGVVGLDQSAALVTTDQVVDKNPPPSPGFRNAPPLSAYWAEQISPYLYPTGFGVVTSPATASWTLEGYTPAQIKTAYGISGAYDGAGQTVAIIDAYASPTILADVNQWSINRGLPTMNPGQLVQVVPPGVYKRAENKVQDPQGWWGEETLDVEAVHGMAPAAKIVFVASPNAYQDMDAAMNHVVDRGLAQIVTNSYGWWGEAVPRGFIKPLEDTLIQAAAEGIGVYFSSGDNGDETSILGYAEADFPASSPWVTAVGGTSLAIYQNGARGFETGWGTSNYNCTPDPNNPGAYLYDRTGWLYGSGGGLSHFFAEPWYQVDAGLSFDGRAVPDVAALGDPQTGLLIGQTQSFPDGAYYDEYRVGGTSLSSPIFAGLMALAEQKAGTHFGFANPLFYATPGAFYDVISVRTAVARRNFNNSVDASAGTADKLRTFDDYSGSPTQSTGSGWDNVTGLGVPIGVFAP